MHETQSIDRTFQIQFSLITRLRDKGLNGEETPLTWIYQALKANDDFRLLFADRIKKHFYNGGALTNAHLTARFLELRDDLSEVFNGIFNMDMDTFILDTFIPERRGIILNAFVQEELLPLADADLGEELGPNEADYDVPDTVGAMTQAPAEEDGMRNSANGHYYILTEAMDWMGAEARAIDLGGHLVTVNTREEELWLRRQFGTQEHFWLGFNDLAEEGTWEWVNGEPTTYTNWASGEPNNFNNNEDAAIMNWAPGTEQDGDWNDASVNGNIRGIVEVPK